MNNLDEELKKKKNVVGYKTITKDTLQSIINKSIMYVKRYKKTNDGINRYAFYYMNKPISIIDDSPTFLNYLNPTEVEFMEHLLGILPRTIKPNTRINLDKSKYLSTIKYPVSEKNVIKKTRRVGGGIKWNSKVHVKHFDKNLPVSVEKSVSRN